MPYQHIIRPILFRFTDPEKIHHAVINGLGLASRQKPLYNFLHKYLANTDKKLHTKIGSLNLESPVGLAAGFDKYIEAPLAYPMLGFGFAELGSITYNEQPGNPPPRLWRIPKDKGLIVNYGLSNSGAIKTSEKISLLVNRPVPYGISIAPSTGIELADLADDYLKTLDHLHPFADYITLNVSCPNVAKHDQFAQINFIEELLEKVYTLMKLRGINKDVFIKIGPHSSEQDIRRIVAACIKSGLTGIIATNLLKIRSGLNFKSKNTELDHPGGISGRLLQAESDAKISQIYGESQGKLKIIGVGGIFTAEDAYRKIKLGASAVQVMTGFIYGGPMTIKKINDGLGKLLQEDGFKNISEAVGKGK
ncbi:MAG: quinone-dependent dihydroorotate dehydrogenase [Patescibacteria group bacterium]